MTRDEFEVWLADMDDALERWLGTLEPTVQVKLDYSVASLDVVEQVLLDEYPSVDTALAQREPGRLDGFARYVGEAMRRRLGAAWDIVLDHPKDLFFGIPILRAKGMRTNECPLSLVTATLDRRTGRYLRACAEAHGRAVDAAQ